MKVSFAFSLKPTLLTVRKFSKPEETFLKLTPI